MADKTEPFAGFGPDTAGFLAGLEADNSKAKTPYHPHLDLAWWQGERPKTSPALIMRIRHDEMLTGVGVFALADDRLDRYRAAVVDEPGVELERIIAAITAPAFADHVADRLGAYTELHRWLVTHT